MNKNEEPNVLLTAKLENRSTNSGIFFVEAQGSLFEKTVKIVRKKVKTTLLFFHAFRFPTVATARQKEYLQNCNQSHLLSSSIPKE